MTKVYFVRHAQPRHDWDNDRTRPLTEEGVLDTAKVLELFKGVSIDKFYCSPYTRSLQTIKSTAEYYGKEIAVDERLREREKGANSDTRGMFHKRWEDKEFHEDGGESIQMVQDRNIAALTEILKENDGKTIVIGTHGTALSSILNYYDNTFQCESFLRLIDWMPFIIELDFEGQLCINKIEHLYVEKEFKGKIRADK